KAILHQAQSGLRDQAHDFDPAQPNRYSTGPGQHIRNLPPPRVRLRFANPAPL
ncbi:Hypothetical predicted protein, partial [Marmota monax]